MTLVCMHIRVCGMWSVCMGGGSTLVVREGRGRGRVECVVGGPGDRGVGELGCVEAVYSQVSLDGKRTIELTIVCIPCLVN